MMGNCNNCNRQLETWGRYKDAKMKYGTLIAAVKSVLTEVAVTASGGIQTCFQKHDKKTTELYYCKHCKRYYLKCPLCGYLIEIKDLPTETFSKYPCGRCKKIIMYSEENYS